MRSWIDRLSSTAFKKAGQSQSQIDRLRSALHRNGTFFPASFVIHSKIRLSVLFALSKPD